MILTDYYKGEQLSASKSRYDITASTGEYDWFERLLINKKSFNVGGLSFNYVPRPDRWQHTNESMAITKGSDNISSIKRPDPVSEYGHGDVKGTTDACIFVVNADFRECGVTTIELFIARGLKNEINTLWNLLTNGELADEMQTLRERAVTKNVTGKIEKVSADLLC